MAWGPRVLANHLSYRISEGKLKGKVRLGELWGYGDKPFCFVQDREGSWGTVSLG